MANSDRLNKNRNGQMLIPMNVEGGAWEEGFFTSTKVCIIIATVFINAGMFMWLSTLYVNWPIYVMTALILVFIDQLVLRYLIFEEKYYYRMYQKMKQYEISTPSVFWNISTMRETEDGAVLVYADGKVGIILRVERDTITGKNPDFREVHYDAISDFYKEINLKNLKFVQMNIMEQAGKDPRLQELDKLVIKADNKNIAKIVESQVGYIKKVTRATLFESDYFLIYCDDLNRAESIVTDAIDCVYKLLDGAFIGFRILSSNDVLELVKEQYGVKYFDYTEATVNMYRNSGVHIAKAFKLIGVNYASGEEADIGNVENNRLIALASYINKGIIKHGEWTIKEALSGKIRNNKSSQNRRKLAGFDAVDIVDTEVKKADVNLDDDIFGETPEETGIADTVADKASALVDDILYPQLDDNDLVDIKDIVEETQYADSSSDILDTKIKHKKSIFNKKKG